MLQFATPVGFAELSVHLPLHKKDDNGLDDHRAKEDEEGRSKGNEGVVSVLRYASGARLVSRQEKLVSFPVGEAVHQAEKGGKVADGAADPHRHNQQSTNSKNELWQHGVELNLLLCLHVYI